MHCEWTLNFELNSVICEAGLKTWTWTGWTRLSHWYMESWAHCMMTLYCLSYKRTYTIHKQWFLTCCCLFVVYKNYHNRHCHQQWGHLTMCNYKHQQHTQYAINNADDDQFMPQQFQAKLHTTLSNRGSVLYVCHWCITHNLEYQVLCKKQNLKGITAG